jgi:hypothetical protein
MKFRVPFRTAAAVASLAFLAACSKDEETLPMGMTWSLDGSSMSADLSSARTSGGTVNVGGFPNRNNSSDRSILLQLPQKTGTFDLAGTEVEAAYLGSSSSVYIATSGTIKVTKYSSTNIAGTFSFRAENSNGATRNVSNGKFNVNY